MINPNNLKQLSDSLQEILGTPVSEQILSLIIEGQRNLLARLIYKWSIGEDHQETIIYSILDYGRNKLPKKEHSDKVKTLLFNKGLI